MKISEFKPELNKKLSLHEDIVTISIIATAITMAFLIVKKEIDAYNAHKRSMEIAAQIKNILHTNPNGSEKFFNHLLDWTKSHNFSLLIKLEKIVNDSLMNHGVISPEDVEEFNSSDVRADIKRKLMTFSADVNDPDEKKFINGLLDVIGNV